MHLPGHAYDAGRGVTGGAPFGPRIQALPVSDDESPFIPPCEILPHDAHYFFLPTGGVIRSDAFCAQPKRVSQCVLVSNAKVSPPMECVGFDPGGKNAFGWCVVSFEGKVPVCVGGVASSAADAFATASSALKAAPAAVGIDAPLFWAAGEDRAADRAVRALVRAAGGHNGTVGHVNSLKGACLVQGILIARMAVENWPAAAITEAHPKALRLVSQAAHNFGARPELVGTGDHLRDAALAAFAAHALATGATGWRDLVALERAPFFPSGAPVRYWFPAQ